MTDIGKLPVNIGDIPAGVFSATPLARDFVLHSQNGQEIMRLDKEGMVFMGERITDAGEAYVAWMKTMAMMQEQYAQPKYSLSDEEILQIGHAAGALEGNNMLPITFARAIEQKIWEKAE